jgi:hypothetical protein
MRSNCWCSTSMCPSPKWLDARRDTDLIARRSRRAGGRHASSLELDDIGLGVLCRRDERASAAAQRFAVRPRSYVRRKCDAANSCATAANRSTGCRPTATGARALTSACAAGRASGRNGVSEHRVVAVRLAATGRSAVRRAATCRSAVLGTASRVAVRLAATGRSSVRPPAANGCSGPVPCLRPTHPGIRASDIRQ